jgi:2-dehydro-3-deoxy-D-arabinonate dehydratase
MRNLPKRLGRSILAASDMKRFTLYNTRAGVLVDRGGKLFDLPGGPDWDAAVNREDLCNHLDSVTRNRRPHPRLSPADLDDVILPPISRQEVWAAGVTYLRSRKARMEESEAAHGGDIYDRIYSAERPELFFKATPERVVGHNREVRIRRDSNWSVPEPELALLVTSTGRIVGYTVGNDMSARDIEGENPLYLPQAKMYDGSCSLGPGVLVIDEDLPSDTRISLEVIRPEPREKRVFQGRTSLGRMKRPLTELTGFLFREYSFPHGCYLLTGTGVVPPASFSLRVGDEIRITIDPIGTLRNRVG